VLLPPGALDEAVEDAFGQLPEWRAVLYLRSLGFPVDYLPTVADWLAGRELWSWAWQETAMLL
jgi:hypothetical protein